MAYAETPRTDAGNATLMTNGRDLENFSIENSLLSPLKRKDTRDDLLAQMRNGRGSLKTPKARFPLADRKNLPSFPARQEFTPLLHSVTKKNFERRGRLSGQPETPAFLKGSLQHSDSPALPGTEVSVLYGSELGSSVMIDTDRAPMPQIAGSSEQSTPLAVLPKRDGNGVLTDQGNLMTLREQENIINKVEKENFGLKLKIHFLEESLRKAGPGFNEAALKENTDLKVDRITLQKELSRCKKMLSQAERDVEALRRHMEEVQERVKHKLEDQKLQVELERLKETLLERETEVEEMRAQVETAESQADEVDKLKANIEDLEVDLREKDRVIDERDEEIDKIKSDARKEADELDGAEAEIDEAKRRIEELENDGGKIAEAAERLEEAQAELREALEGKERAEADLDELRDEMSNKSINTKGLSRQLEDKANRLQDDLTDLREKYAQVQTILDDKSREVKRLEEALKDREQDADTRDQRLKDQNELLRNENESLARKSQHLNDQMQQAIKDLQNKSEEKDLLHSRHDALTQESHQLQRDLAKSRTLVADYEQSLKDERQHAEDNDRKLRSEARNEIDRLSAGIDDLHREIEANEVQGIANEEKWDSQRRGLEAQKAKAEEQASGLQRTISKLQETEGTLSSREMQLQEVLESEKQRHEGEEAVLQQQIQDLNDGIVEKCQALDDLRKRLWESKEEVRISQRDQADLEEKVQALEDEVEVLQTGLDDEAEKVKDEMNAVEQEANRLRSLLDAAKKELSQSQVDEANNDRSGLESRLRQAEIELKELRVEKLSLQDQVATHNQEMRQLETSVVEIEAERDELQYQLQRMRGQVDDTFRVDQEKLELRTSKTKLDNEAARLRKEQQNLEDSNKALERRLEDETSRANAEEVQLRDEVVDLQHKLSQISGGRDRELSAAKQTIQRLEARLSELESRLANNDNVPADAAELSILQKDLSAARKRETDFLQRETVQKSLLRDLKLKIARLESQLHDAELARAVVDSPKSSVNASARKSELIEIRRQLLDTQQQLRNTRSKSKDDLDLIQQRLLASEKHNQNTVDACEQLEADLSRTQHEQASLQAANAASTATITRLRTRISSLENDRARRHGTVADDTIAEERKDLHDLLKDSKLHAEDLQVQIASRETSIAAAATREKGLRAQLKRVREERSLQTQRSSALAMELDSLHQRYEQVVENHSRQQSLWQDERRSMASKVRFPNTSFSELHANEKDLEKRHAGELRVLAKQIQWLRAKLHREGTFREGLVYEKKWLLLRIGMFEACNATDLELLSEMGVNPQTNSATATRLRLGDAIRGNAHVSGEKRKRPSLRTVVFAIIAGARMRRMASDWAVQRRAKEALGKKLEGMGKRRASYAH